MLFLNWMPTYRNELSIIFVLAAIVIVCLSYWCNLKCRREIRQRQHALDRAPSTTWGTKTVWAFCITAVSILPLSIAYAFSSVEVSTDDAERVLATFLVVSLICLVIQVLVSRKLPRRSKELSDFLNGKESVSPSDKRIIKSALASRETGLRSSQTWRSREDFHQRLLYRAICERIFFDGSRFRARLSFIGLYGAPLLVPFAVLLVSPAVHGAWSLSPFRPTPEWTDGEKVLFGLVAVNWALWSVLYYFLLCYWILSPIFKTLYTRPIFGLTNQVPLDRVEIARLKGVFRGQAFRFMNIAFIVTVPLYLTLIEAFH